MSFGNSDFLKNTFCNVVKDYDYARPGYPAELYQNIRAFAGLGENAQLLEVGAGTGQATELFLDVHLMIEKPIRYVEHFCKAGSDILTIHVEADTPENTKAALEQIRAMGVKPGIVLKPKTPAEALAPYLTMVDLVLVMTVEPGFGGQKFMADMMPKVKQLRAMLDEVNPSCHLEVDGGVDLKTGVVCKENGANVLVAGSAFFGAAARAAFAKEIEL